MTPITLLVCCVCPVDRPICGAGERARVVHLWVSQARPLFLPRRRAAHLKLATERRLEQLGRKLGGRN